MNNHLLGLYTAIYQVEDLDQSKRWYSRMLGIAPYFDEPFYVGFNVAGYELGLIPVADTERKEKGCVAFWGVKDINATCATLAAKGIQLFEPVKDVGGDIKVASFLDESANIVGLIENPHFPNTSNK
jgi:predicted enzyme related to lactoylglutathione lyase